MGHKNIFERLASKYSISREIYIIEKCFEDIGTINVVEQFESIFELVDDVLPSWRGRGTTISHNDFRKRIGIDEIIKNIVGEKELTDDEIITYLEYALNIIKLVEPRFRDYDAYFSQFRMLEKNVDTLREKMNLKAIPNKSHDGVELVVNSPETTIVAEEFPEEVGVQILRYHHTLLKGDLVQKASILFQMAKEFEQIRRELDSNNYKKLTTDVGFCLNKLNIRHNNKKEIEPLFNGDELEEWYDYTYQLLILCFSAYNYLISRDRIDELKKLYN